MDSITVEGYNLDACYPEKERQVLITGDPIVGFKSYSLSRVRSFSELSKIVANDMNMTNAVNRIEQLEHDVKNLSTFKADRLKNCPYCGK